MQPCEHHIVTICRNRANYTPTRPWFPLFAISLISDNMTPKILGHTGDTGGALKGLHCVSWLRSFQWRPLSSPLSSQSHCYPDYITATICSLAASKFTQTLSNFQHSKDPSDKLNGIKCGIILLWSSYLNAKEVCDKRCVVIKVPYF